MNSPRIAKWLLEGVALHQAGRMEDAQALYDKVLKIDRHNPDALNLKGLIASHAGRHEIAIALYDRSIASYPAFADAHYNKGVSLTALGRGEDALTSYATAVRIDPTHANARLNAGSVLHGLGRFDEAISVFRGITKTFPTDARGFYNLGTCLIKGLSTTPQDKQAEIVNEAISALTHAQKLDPSNPDIRVTLANAHAIQGAFALAIEQLRATELAPDWSTERRAETLSTLGEYLRKDKQYSAAIETQRRALALHPNHSIIEYNLAAALSDAKHFDEAETVYKRVIAAKPDFIKAWVNLGDLYRQNNRHDEAMAIFEKAVTIQPTPQVYANMAVTTGDLGWPSTSLMLHNKALSLGPMDAGAKHNHAMALLNIGQLQAGWDEYDARFAVTHNGTPPRTRPEWRGEDLAGKRVLVWTEEGAGDQILHASMIPDLIARGGHVLIECLARLAPVFARSFPSATIIERHHPTDPAAEREAYDYQIAAGSLGRHFRRDFADFPTHAGYLKADPSKVRTFRSAYEAMAQGRRIIGIAWRSRNPDIGSSKSASLTNFGAILQTPGIMFVNLQYGDCAADLAEARNALGVDIFHDHGVDQLRDMDSFFAQVAAMDSVVSTSNTAVHVAAAQNIPTWLMLPHGRGTMWYWFLRRSDSPWYPSVTIERARTIDPNLAWEIEPARRIASRLARDSKALEQG